MADSALSGKFTEVEGTFDANGKELYTKTWLPTGPTQAKLVHIHGYSDHINRYYDFFPTLASRGIAVYGFDQRGWGRSVKKPSEKGLTGPTSLVLADMAAFITPHLPKTEADPPLFVLGHSMGGGQVATMLCDPEYDDLIKQVRGWLLECPFIGWYETVKPSKFKEFAGRLAGKILPHVQLVSVIPAADLSRDPDVVISIEEDKLMHNTGTLEGLAGMMDRTAALTNHVGKLSPHLKSLWQGDATEDKGVSAEEAKKWYDAVTTGVPDRTFKWYEGCYHQLHSDYGKEVFYKDVGDWILARADRGKGEDAGQKQAQATAAAPGTDSEVKTEAKL